jgi:hypothetical protein
MTEPKHTTEENAASAVTSPSGWKKAGTHVIRLHSGAYVKIRIPDLPTLIEAGHIPNNLLDVALAIAGGQQPKEVNKDLIMQSAEFTDLMVAKTVIEPRIGPGDDEIDVKDVPVEDKQLIVEIATRQRDVDAEGHYLSGLETSEKFRRFRRIGEFDPILADL